MTAEISTLTDDAARHAELLAAIAAIGGTPPVETPTTPTVGGRVLVFDAKKAALNPTQLWWKKSGQYCWSCFHELRFDLTLEEETYIKVFGNVNLVHRNNVVGAIGYGIKASVRSAASFADMPAIPASSVDLAYWQSVEAGKIIPGSKDSGNILGIEDHYGPPKFNYALKLQAGCHRIEHWGNSHRDGATEDNAFAALNQNAVPDAADPYTMLFIEGYR